MESEDEDGFPVSNKHESKSNFKKPEVEVQETDGRVEKTNDKTEDADGATNLKRKVENIDQEGRPEKWVGSVIFIDQMTFLVVQIYEYDLLEFVLF